jgi:hypothetical protein
VRQQSTDPGPRFAILFEGIKTFPQLADLAEEWFDFPFAGQRLIVEFLQLRLVVKCINLAHSAGRENVDASLGAGNVMQARDVASVGTLFFAMAVLSKERRERHCAQAASGVRKPIAARKNVRI